MAKWLLAILILLMLSPSAFSAPNKIHMLVWSEGGEPKNIYPQGINGAIAAGLVNENDMLVTIANFNSPAFGLSQKSLDQTDVLIWFGHEKHDAIPDEIAQYIVQRVKKHGMGLIMLHSSHLAKPFTLLLHSTGKWADYQDTGQPEKMEIISPNHPIAKNIKAFFIPKTEMYIEPFQVPRPDDVIVEGVWDKQHRSREVMTWTINNGRLVYIRAGHEAYPIYYMPEMQQLIANAVRWAAKKT